MVTGGNEIPIDSIIAENFHTGGFIEAIELEINPARPKLLGCQEYVG